MNHPKFLLEILRSEGFYLSPQLICKIEETGTNNWTVTSYKDSKPLAMQSYRITKFRDLYSCTCADFIYRASHDCKHITALKHTLAQVQK